MRSILIKAINDNSFQNKIKDILFLKIIFILNFLITLEITCGFCHPVKQRRDIFEIA